MTRENTKPLKTSLLITIFFVHISCLPLNLFAQKDEQQIEVGVITGINATQVDGDDLAGYHKLGFNFGGIARWKFHKKFSANFELLYNMKGSQSPPTKNSITLFKLRLNYIDIPFLINYHDKQVNFGLGLSYGRLIKFEEILNGVSNPYTTQPKKTDIDIIVNGNYEITEHFTFNLRFSNSLLGFRPFLTQKGKIASQRNRLVSIRFIYFI